MRKVLLLLAALLSMTAAAQTKKKNKEEPATQSANLAAELISAAESQPSSQPAAAEEPASTHAKPAHKLTEIPLEKGLPVVVRAGLAYIDVHEVDENGGTFTATVDMRLRWEDPRLRYPKEETPRGFYEYRGKDVEDKLEEVWVPTVRILNLEEEASMHSTGLRIFPDGWVEMIVRTKAVFKAEFDTTAFPFDKQQLAIELASDKENAEQVTFQFLQGDLNFSRTYEGVELEGWTIGLVTLKKLVTVGWYGEFYSGVTVALEIKRQAGRVVAPIFIPLLASLLIPLLAIWMNGVEDGEFKVDAFELANVIIGGLFAVIALNFTVNSEYTSIASGDNTVTRLFGLNYLALAVALGIVVLLYRFNVLKLLFGRYVQEQFFHYLSWAVPVLAFGTAGAFIFVAMV